MNAITLRQGASGPELTDGTAGQVPVRNADGTVSFGNPSAAAIAYTPATAVDWPVPAPATIAAAVDNMALTAAEQLAAGALGPGATITFTTGPITPIKSGVFLVVATIAGVASGAATEACELLSDAVSQSQATVETGAVAHGFQCTLVAVAVLDRTVPHTFTVRATASAGTNTAPSASAKIVLVELGG